MPEVPGKFVFTVTLGDSESSIDQELTFSYEIQHACFENEKDRIDMRSTHVSINCLRRTFMYFLSTRIGITAFFLMIGKQEQ